MEKSASTTKLRRSQHHMKSYDYKEKNEVKSMPDIQTHNKEKL